MATRQKKLQEAAEEIGKYRAWASPRPSDVQDVRDERGDCGDEHVEMHVENAEDRVWYAAKYSGGHANSFDPEYNEGS